MGTIMVSHLARLRIDDHNRGYVLLAVIYCCLQWPLPAGAHGTGAVHNHGSLFPHCIFNKTVPPQARPSRQGPMVRTAGLRGQKLMYLTGKPYSASVLL
jgi:hypothetical protein